MSDESAIIWWLWCPVSALIVQWLCVRIIRPQTRFGAQAVGCTGWLVCLAASLAFATFCGLQLYGFDPASRWQQAAYYVLFFSPIGLPMAIGAPVVLFLQSLAKVPKRIAAIYRRA